MATELPRSTGAHDLADCAESLLLAICLDKVTHRILLEIHRPSERPNKGLGWILGELSIWPKGFEKCTLSRRTTHCIEIVDLQRERSILSVVPTNDSNSGTAGGLKYSLNSCFARRGVPTDNLRSISKSSDRSREHPENRVHEGCLSGTVDAREDDYVSIEIQVDRSTKSSEA